MKKSYFLNILVLCFLFTAPNVYAYCPLGPDVTKDLYGVLMILKIVAPFLCIGLSVFDAIKALTKGDPASDLKAVAKRFGKRVLYAIILFFIPVLVDIFFQIADIWDANGSCDLFTPESNGQTTSSTTKETRTTNKNCPGHKDKEACNRDQKCYWDNSNNVCKDR